MPKEITKRLLELIEHFYKGNRSAFSRELDFNKSTISTMINRGGTPSTEFILKVLSAHKDVDANWLLLGKGTMLEAQEKDDSNNGESVSRNEVTNLRKEIEYLKEGNSQLKEINSFLKRQLDDLTSASK